MPDESVTREIFGNIDVASKCVFYALAVLASGCFIYGIFRRARLWLQGRAKPYELNWRRCLHSIWTGILSQRQVKQDRRGAGIAHVLLFISFSVLFVGTILIAVEHYSGAIWGRDAANPIFHKGLYFAFYEVVLDTAGLALLAGCAWFMVRRWRGNSSIGHVASDWLVLATITLLGISGFLAEGLRIIREETPMSGFSYVGWLVAQGLSSLGVKQASTDMLHFFLWWSHSVLAFGLIAAIPYTRLLHTVAGALNLSMGIDRMGSMTPISIEEVEETGLVGASKIGDFSRRQLMQLDACVSCGRCQDACPANQAGKPLSPRDVVQDLRVQLNSMSGDPLSDTIAAETVWSCTTCHACVDKCPLGVDPLQFITDMRRNLVGEGQLRGTPASSLQRMQRSGNPWGIAADERMNWAAGLNVPQVGDTADFEVLYWVGCAAAYDRRIQKVARALVKLMHAAEVKFAVLGPEERCTGESARRMGDEFLFQELAAGNLDALAKYSVKKIVTHCPHCLNSLRNDYPQFGGHFEVVHHTQFLAELVSTGRLQVSPSVSNQLTYHDPCYLARVNGVTAEPRQLIQLAVLDDSPGQVTELPRRGRNTACCGAGGGRMWFDDEANTRAGGDRIEEIAASGAEQVVVACPFCLTMVKDGIAATNHSINTVDIAELLADGLDHSAPTKTATP